MENEQKNPSEPAWKTFAEVIGVEDYKFWTDYEAWIMSFSRTQRNTQKL